MFTYNPFRYIFQITRYAGLPILVIGVTVSLGLLFHIRGEQVVEQQLRERMLSTVSIAALNIDPEMVRRVRSTKDMKTTAFTTLVKQLKEIRELTPHARFAYIMRATNDPMTVTFVADADSLSTLEELDVNKNGVIDPDEEEALPGETYSVSPGSSLMKQAFERAVVEKEFIRDQWGTLLSAFAPIKDAKGVTVGVLGLDIESDVFFQVTQNTFSLVAVALVALVGTLLTIYILLIIRARHLESLKQLDAERTALLDLATHQLGMPLATFRWWLELLKERDNGTFCKRGDVCDQLQEGIDRMDSIIRGLQEAGRMREGTVSDAGARCSLSVVTKEVMQALKKTVSIRKQTIKVFVSSKLPLLKLDRKLCEGLLRELLENASAYSPVKSVIEIHAKVVRNMVELKVIDHGHGIPKKDLPFIFQQFKRGSNATKYKPAGNGLGLFIVRRIVERTRGKIAIESQLEHGTTVTVLLPYSS